MIIQTKKDVIKILQKHQDKLIEWRKIAGMRYRLIHNYFGVDYDIVWDVIVTEVPRLNIKVKEILEVD